MTPQSRLSRRRFVGTLAAAPIVLATSRGVAAPNPSSRITLGIIGMGVRARQLLGSFLRDPGVQVISICDVVRERREHGKKLVEEHYTRQKGKGGYKGCKVENDFRQV